MKMKILILGSDGMVGSMMTSYLSNKERGYDVTSLGRKDFDAVTDSLPDLSNYDYVINCIGLIKQKTIENNPLYYILNSEFPHKLSAACNKVIHISSDCVFSGNLESKFSYKVDSVKDAEDDYGKSKAQGEPSNCMVLRTSIIGPSKKGFGLFEWFKNTSDDPVKGFSNHFWSGVTTLELAKIINEQIRYKLYYNGVHQIAGNKVSKLTLLQLINDIFELKKNIIACEDIKTINRSLIGDINAIPIKRQLKELKLWMDNEAS